MRRLRPIGDAFRITFESMEFAALRRGISHRNLTSLAIAIGFVAGIGLYAETARALVIEGGPTYAGSGGVSGSCIVSGNACTAAGATVTCTGLNPGSFRYLYYGIKNDTNMNGLKEVGSAGPVAGTDQFKTGTTAPLAISYTGTTTIHDNVTGSNRAVNSKLILTATAGSPALVATGGTPADTTRGDIDHLFQITGSSITLNVKVQAALSPTTPTVDSCTFFNGINTTDGIDRDVSSVDLGFYFENLCGNGVVDAGFGEQCDTAITTNGCCNSTCQFSASGTSCTDDTDPCTTDLCGGTDTTCNHAAGNDGANCDDSDFCTSSDICAAGTCAGTLDPAQCVDSFKCYKAKQSGPNGLLPKGIVVNLVDALETKDTSVVTPNAECNVVDVSDVGMPASGTIDNTNHLVQYKIKDDKTVSQPMFTPVTMNLSDQFQVVSVVLKKPRNLSLPSSRLNTIANGGIDHFKCYSAKGAPGTPRMAIASKVLADQDETKQMVVFKLNSVCLPVDQDGGGILNPNVALSCYKIKDEKINPLQPKFVARFARMQNEFVTQSLSLKKPSVLCVPAILTPTP